MTTPALLAIAGTALVSGILLAAWHPRVWLALCVAGSGAALAAALSVLLGARDWEWRSGFALGGEPLHLRLDGLSALFLVLLCAVGCAGALYAHEFWSERHYPRSAARGRGWWVAMIASMGLVLLSSNGLHFLIAWELQALAGYFLITLDDRRRAVCAAGWLYLAASHVGTLCLFAFFAALAAYAGGWDLGPMLEHSERAPLFWLALVGFGVKAGFFPLHVWLPAAHANAPSHVSAILSGVSLKLGIYGIVRFGGWLPLPAGAGWVVIVLGAASALFGIAFALVQDDLKRLLAYCSVEHVGVILIGVGAALLAATHGNETWGRLALAGALLHVWNHGAFKSLLFFGAGSVLHATGTREMSRLGGLWARMPWTAALFALGAAAISGLPPLNGFVSEWLVYLGLFDAAAGRAVFAAPAMPAAILLAVAGALALATFVKAAAIVFLGAPRTQAAREAHECGAWMRGPMIALAGVCAVTGLWPALVWPALARAVGSWNPVWVGAWSPPPLRALGALHLVLAATVIVAAVLLRQRARQNGMRRALTWDCGYAQPTARMQYTSGAFAGIAGGWLAALFRPETRQRRPRGPFPVAGSYFARVPEAVLERVIMPAGGRVMRVALAARRLQHGRLQAYILFLVVGLAGVAALVLAGSKP
jgi:hydrogenase-4 component B